MRKGIGNLLCSLTAITIAIQAHAQASDAASPTSVSSDPAVAEASQSSAGTVSQEVIPVFGDETKPGANSGGNRLIEEVVVTAQKREQNIRDVPISIQAFTQDKLDVLGIQSVQDVQRATPGFTVTNAAGFNIVFLRGVGSDAFLPGVDSSVPFYLDGVPLLGIQGTADTLGRIKRVEVLKGPQGTLFGRNSTGGAISIITPDPDQVLAGDVKLEYGNYGTHNILAFVNVPVTDRIAFNISGYDNERDNIIHNDSTGGVFDIYSRGGRLKLLWNVLDNLSITLNGNFQENSSNGSLDFELTKPAAAFASVLPAHGPLSHHVDLDSPFGTENRAYILGGTVDWDTSIFDSKLIYAKQRIKSPKVDADFDASPTPLADAHGAGFAGSKQFVRQDTAELQFLSNKGTPFADHLQLAAGLFYLSSLGGFDPIVFNLAPGALNVLSAGNADGLANVLNTGLVTAGIPPLAGQQGIQLANYGLTRSKSYSAYAQGTYHLIDTVDFTGGLRYQYEIRKLEDSKTTFTLANGNQALVPFDQGNDTPTLKPKQLSARVALQWRPFGPETQFYTSWARGYKSPTYNTVNLVGDTFGGEHPLLAERVETTEIGTKALLFGGNLQLNAAGFYTFQKNPLSSNVTIISGGIANFTNAGAATIKGADGDFLLVPLPNLDDGLVITGGFSYLDAVYTEFTNGRGYDDATGVGFGDGGASEPARDLSGKRIPRVPRWSATTGVSQNVKLDGGSSLELGADVFYSTKLYFLPQNSDLSERKALALLNARVSYFYHPWGLELTAYGTNLTNKLYVDSAFVTDFGTSLIPNENPRMYGLRAQVSF